MVDAILLIIVRQIDAYIEISALAFKKTKSSKESAIRNLFLFGIVSFSIVFLCSNIV